MSSTELYNDNNVNLRNLIAVTDLMILIFDEWHKENNSPKRISSMLLGGMCHFIAKLLQNLFWPLWSWLFTLFFVWTSLFSKGITPENFMVTKKKHCGELQLTDRENHSESCLVAAKNNWISSYNETIPLHVHAKGICIKCGSTANIYAVFGAALTLSSIRLSHPSRYLEGGKCYVFDTQFYIIHIAFDPNSSCNKLTISYTTGREYRRE